MSDPVLDALMGGASYPAAEFPVVGTTVGGKVIGRPKARQVREYDKLNPGKGALKFYPNSGDPIMGVVVDVQTNAPMINQDDKGIRRIYADGQRQKEALREALIAAGAQEVGIEPGGFVSMTWSGEEEGQGSVPAKTWSAIYRTPAQQAALGALGAVPVATQPVQQGQQFNPAQAYAVQTYANAPAQQVQQYAPQATPQQYAPAAQYIPTAPANPVAVPAPTGRPQINAVQAAAMANAGVDISIFDIVD